MAPRKAPAKKAAAKPKPEQVSSPANEKSNTGSNRPRPIWEGGWTRLQWQDEIAKWEAEQE